MFNLTHNEDSAIDIGGVWTGPDEFELNFRFNADDHPDINMHLILAANELETLRNYLSLKLIQQPNYVK